MFLKDFRIDGFLGTKIDKGIAISNLSQINLLIGPNNTGKSIPGRFLHLFKQVVTTRKLNHLFSYPAGLDLIDKSSLWKWDSTEPMRFEMTIGRPGLAQDCFLTTPYPITIGDDLVLDGLLFVDEKTAEIKIRPFALIEDKVQPLFLRQGPQIQFSEMKGAAQSSYKTHQGQYLKIESQEDAFELCMNYFPLLEGIMEEWAQSTRFFDPVRALTLGESKNAMDGGQELKTLLENLSTSVDDIQKCIRLRSSIRNAMNWLLEPTGSPEIQSIDFRTTNNSLVVIANINDVAIKLENMGAGISQLFILCAYLELDCIETKMDISRNIINTAHRMYFLEEPESHLHPALIRRFGEYLKQKDNCQFFISTHSTVLLDCLRPKSKAYSFSYHSKTGCQANECSVLADYYDLLDALGVKGSDLLQTNCVLWVEGPSDRIYLNYWIQSGSDLTPPPLEGSDYAFAFYGGSNLCHFSLSNELTDEFIRMTDIGRFAAVLMDSDLPPGRPAAQILQRKRRVVDSADGNRKIAILSNSREIENDLPKLLLKKAAEKILGLNENSLEAAIIDGILPFEKQISFFLSTKKKNRKQVEQKLSNKVKLAKVIVDLAKELKIEMEPPQYIYDIISLIKRSRI